MLFTEENKTFRLLNFVPDYGLWTTETYKGPLTKDEKRLAGLDNLVMKLLQNWTSKR